MRCFHWVPQRQLCRSSVWLDGLSQWWRLPSSLILSVPQQPVFSGFACGHQLVMGFVSVWLMALLSFPRPSSGRLLVQDLDQQIHAPTLTPAWIRIGRAGRPALAVTHGHDAVWLHALRHEIAL